jgi:hypothetical protein
MYPQVCELLLDAPRAPPSGFDLIFAPHKSRHTLARADSRNGRICFHSNHALYQDHSQDAFDRVFVHEMARLATGSRRPRLRLRVAESPVHWIESIADYAAFKLVQIDDHRMVIPGPGDRWAIRNAWRTLEDGTLAEVYPLPGE